MPEPTPARAPPPVALPHAATQRSAVSPAIAQILREEAEREEAARRAEAAALESQPDLGLDRDAVPDLDRRRVDEARLRMARMRGDAAPPDIPPSQSRPIDPAPRPPAIAPTRRDLLPDIEEINSTLRSAADRVAMPQSVEAVVARGRRRGFRAGLMTVLVMALLLAVVYALAQPIALALPVMKQPLDIYVAAVDEGRLWLDLRLQDLLESLRSDTPAPAEG